MRWRRRGLRAFDADQSGKDQSAKAGDGGVTPSDRRRRRDPSADPATDDVAAPSSRHPEFQPLLGVTIKPRSPERDHPGQAALACRGTWLWLSGFRQCTAGGIGTEEQIPERPTQPIRDPSAGQMVRMIMDHVAALTEAFQVALPVVARIMIEMRRRQDDAGLPERHRLLDIRPSRWPAPAAAPGVAHSCRTSGHRAGSGRSLRAAGRIPRRRHRRARNARAG